MGALEHREALRYIALPMEVTVERIPEVVGGAFGRVADVLAERGVEGGHEIIRYVAARASGTFAIEVGQVIEVGRSVEGTPPLDPPFIEGEVPAGEYSVARADGPYARLGAVTQALMDSWGSDGVTPAVAHTTTGDDYAAWYELYVGMPREGPDGPAGAVEVCVLAR